MLKKIIKYIKGYRLYAAISLLMAFLSVASLLYIPVLTGKGIDLIIGAGNVDTAGVFKIIVQGVIVFLAGAFFQWLQGICNNKITYGVVKDIRKAAFLKLMKVPVAYADSHQTGDVVSRMIADVDQFADGLLMGFTQFFSGVLTIAATLIFMFILSPVIAVVVVVLTPLSFVVAKTIAKSTFTMFSKQSEKRAEETAYIDEIIGNVKLVKAFGRTDAAAEHFDKINDELASYSKKAVFYSSLTNPGTRFVNSLVYAAVAGFGAFFSIKGMITIGELTAFLAYANQYTKPFNEISGVVTELQGAFVCAERVFALIEADEQTKDGEHVFTPSVRGEIEFKSVSFSYNDKKKLIENFNLKVKPGMKVAIVGPTGCGKTTLINLLMRFYDVNSGSILLDGVDIKEATRKSLRDCFGMVLQDTWLKSGTIFDNIKMAVPDASDEDVIEAAKLSYADSFIRRLPDGYDTVIGEDGGILSQGQKQLLCIARVMLKRPPLLILDEATSSIDTRTEQKIQGAFLKLMEKRTSFIVAHRLSTIQNADVILCMRDGSIVEKGTHEELLERKGFYYELYSSQL